MKNKKKKKAISSFVARRDALTKFAAMCVAAPIFVAVASSVLSTFGSSTIDLYKSHDFWLAYMAYAATVFIGLLTFINSFVERKLQQEHHAANTKCPCLEISEVTSPKGKPSVCQGKCFTVCASRSATVVIKNFGEGPASDIVVSCNGTDVAYGVLHSNSELILPICVDLSNVSKPIFAEIHYKNILGYPYMQKLEYMLIARQIHINAHLHQIGYDLRINNIGHQERLGEVTQEYK